MCVFNVRCAAGAVGVNGVGVNSPLTIVDFSGDLAILFRWSFIIFGARNMLTFYQ